MKKQIKKILLLYKESVHKNYFLNRTSSLRARRKSLPKENVKRIKEVHKTHYETLKSVESVIRQSGLAFTKVTRGKNVDYKKYDLVITVGGDGTFLEATRHIKNQYILGVNSSPKWSVGSYCRATQKTFPRVFNKILTGKFKVLKINRLRLQNGKKFSDINVLNDVLIAHKNPAAMSRYKLILGKREEEQRSSGVWIATAAGSSGAVHSAGGKKLKKTANQYQYKARELYRGFKSKYHLKGGVLSLSKPIKVVSLMREGVIFVDGARCRLDFPFGSKVTIKKSPNILQMVDK